MPDSLLTACLQLGPGFVAMLVMLWLNDRLLKRHDREMSLERQSHWNEIQHLATMYEAFFYIILARTGASGTEIEQIQRELEEKRRDAARRFPRRDSDPAKVS